MGPFAADHITMPGIRALLGRFLNLEFIVRRFLASSDVLVRAGHARPASSDVLNRHAMDAPPLESGRHAELPGQGDMAAR